MKQYRSPEWELIRFFAAEELLVSGDPSADSELDADELFDE